MSQQTQFVTCPRCRGASRSADKARAVCSECGGVGVGTFIKNDFFYWGYDMTPGRILVRQSRRIFDNIILVILAAIGIGGVAALVWWAAEKTIAPSRQLYLGRLLAFWQERDGRILFFWVGLLVLLFAYVRLQRGRERRQPVRFFKYWQWQKLQRRPQRVPNNWGELRRLKSKHDVAQSYDTKLLVLLEQAALLADELKHHEIVPLHVLVSMLSPGKRAGKNRHAAAVKELFGRLGIGSGKLIPKLKDALKQLPAAATPNGDKMAPAPVGPALQKCLLEGYVTARAARHERVGALDVIEPLLANGPALQALCDELQINSDALSHVVVWLNLQAQARAAGRRRERRRRQRLQQRMYRATNAVATPVLNHFCIDLTDAARAGRLPLSLERRALLEALYEHFKKITQPVLLGETGSGRYTILETLAERMAADDVPKKLRGKKLMLLNARKLAAEGGEMTLEKKFAVILAEALVAGDVVIAIADITEPLWRTVRARAGAVAVIVTATVQYAGMDEALIQVAAPATGEIIEMYAAHAVSLAERHSVYFEYDALKIAAEATLRHLAGPEMLDQGVGLLKAAAGEAAKNTDRRLTAAFIAKIFAARVNVPYTKILKGE